MLVHPLRHWQWTFKDLETIAVLGLWSYQTVRWRQLHIDIQSLPQEVPVEILRLESMQSAESQVIKERNWHHDGETRIE